MYYEEMAVAVLVRLVIVPLGEVVDVRRVLEQIRRIAAAVVPQVQDKRYPRGPENSLRRPQ